VRCNIVQLSEWFPKFQMIVAPSS